MIKIAVPGITGRMGTYVAQQVISSSDLTLIAAIARANNPMIGSKFSGTDVIISTSFPKEVDVIIDFTLPEGVMEHLKQLKPIVIGTTGFSDEQMDIIKESATRIPILISANMSVGVNLCYKLLREAANALDDNWDIVVKDIHHKHKKDTPSGTAKQIANIISEKKVSIESERRDEIIGEHQVTFNNQFEEIIIGHKAKDRGIFAKGAIAAARWLVNKPPGIYSMQDVVG